MRAGSRLRRYFAEQVTIFRLRVLEQSTPARQATEILPSMAEHSAPCHVPALAGAKSQRDLVDRVGSGRTVKAQDDLSLRITTLPGPLNRAIRMNLSAEMPGYGTVASLLPICLPRLLLL